MKGTMSERSPGSWTCWVDAGRDPKTGKRTRLSRTVRGTKREAQRALAAFVAEVSSGALTSQPSRQKLDAYLATWLTDHAASAGLAPATVTHYRQVTRDYVIPHLGAVPLGKLTPAAVQGLYSHLLTSGRKNGQPLATGSVLLVHRCLSLALGTAVRLQLIPRNVCQSVKPPRVQRDERPVLDGEGVARLLAAVEGSWIRLPIILAVATGLRRGEVLGLRWSDLDLSAGTLKVAQAAQKLTGEPFAFRRPKTEAGKRTITLPEFLVTELRRHRARQAEERLAMGPSYAAHNLVIAAPDGSPRDPDYLTRLFSQAAARAGFPEMHFHDLRHTHATGLLGAGLPLKVVSARLGHASAAVTLAIYAHVLPEQQTQAAALTQTVFGKALTG